MTDLTPRDGVVAPFFSDPDFDFEFRDALGATAYGVGDLGLWLATAARIVDGDWSSWFTAWSDRARELAALAEASTADPATASWAYLAASAAWSRAMGAIDGMPADQGQTALLPTFRESRRCWEAVIDASSGRHVRLDIPYEDTSLPGWLLRPDASGMPRPTLVMTNGSDGALAGMWSYGAAEALARGWNALVYDGPGQQSLLFERGVPFRPDWEAVLTPVVDALVGRADVDPAALTAYGISQAGYWLPRALSAEHRFVAAVTDPGVVDVSTSWMNHLPPPMIALLDAGDKATFNSYMAQVSSDPAEAREFAFRARPYGVDDPYDLFTAVRTYQLRDVAARIRTPLLITAPDDEQFWPGQSDELADLLEAPHEVVRFTREDGANRHCQPLGRRITATRMLAWLEAQLKQRPPA